MIISGSLIYNELVVIPFLGFNEHLLIKKKKKDPSFVYERIQENTEDEDEVTPKPFDPKESMVRH